jgi:hypothetical protein
LELRWAGVCPSSTCFALRQNVQAAFFCFCCLCCGYAGNALALCKRGGISTVCAAALILSMQARHGRMCGCMNIPTARWRRTGGVAGSNVLRKIRDRPQSIARAWPRLARHRSSSGHPRQAHARFNHSSKHDREQALQMRGERHTAAKAVAV